MARSLKVASLFSGAGGLDRGIHLAGHDVVLLCESDAGARQVLRAAFPGTRIHEDVCSLERLPQCTELVIAGFPCIDVSRAGLRRGLEGQSTGLVRHVFRLLRASKEEGCPVPWVLLENVEALLDRHQGGPPVMQYVVRQFRELGYGSVAWRVVNSAGFGLPNRRKRVFILASLHGDARDVLLTQGVQKCHGGCSKLFGAGARCYHCHMEHVGRSMDHDDVSYALDLGNAQSQAGVDVVPTFTTSNDRMMLLLSSGLSGMLRIEDAERLQGFPEGHTAPCWPIQQPGIGAHRNTRVKDSETEIHASKRWDLLGNAVTVPVARWLGERLAQPYAYKYNGIGPGERRMDWLLDEGHEAEPRQPLNIWSFVTGDELQQALIFEPRQPAAGGAAAGAEAPAAAAAAAAAAAVPPPLPLPSPGLAAGPGGSGSAQEGEGGDRESGREEDEARAARAADETMAEIEAGEDGEQPEGEEGQDLRKHMFQGDLLHKVRRGQVSTSLPSKGKWARDSWPRSGWWVAGLGCYAVKDMSDSPVPTPFQPLGTFIAQVGRQGTPEEMESYLQRLRERGFEVSPTLKKALQTGVRVCKQAQEISRIPDLLSDADLIGDLVWVKDERFSKLWWPGEVLDPYGMPKGRMLPEKCEEELTPTEKVASLPWVASKARMAPDPSERRVVVAFLPVGGSLWIWASRDKLLDFEAHLAAKEGEMRQALREPGLRAKYGEQLRQAVQDAKASLAIKKGRGGADADRMRRTRAAAAAASVNLKLRCGACRTCMNNYANQRRYECLTQRMKAAALSGHAGAQVAIMGEDAVGARVAVWWDGDQTSYEGFITHFDAVSTEHTVCYDDGEVGMHRLWQHDERIKVLSPVAHWPRDAAIVRERLGAAHAELHSRKRQRREVTAAATTAAAGAPATAYEQQRQRIIERNRRMFDMTVGAAARDVRRQQAQQAGEEEPGEEEPEGGHRVQVAAAAVVPQEPALKQESIVEEEEEREGEEEGSGGGDYGVGGSSGAGPLQRDGARHKRQRGGMAGLAAAATAATGGAAPAAAAAAAHQPGGRGRRRQGAARFRAGKFLKRAPAPPGAVAAAAAAEASAAGTADAPPQAGSSPADSADGEGPLMEMHDSLRADASSKACLGVSPAAGPSPAAAAAAAAGWQAKAEEGQGSKEGSGKAVQRPAAELSAGSVEAAAVPASRASPGKGFRSPRSPRSPSAKGLPPHLTPSAAPSPPGPRSDSPPAEPETPAQQASGGGGAESASVGASRLAGGHAGGRLQQIPGDGQTISEFLSKAREERKRKAFAADQPQELLQQQQ